MHETTPAVFLIARPSIDLEGMRGYLRDVGGESWLERRLEEADGEPNAGELLVEFGGRACYRSWEPGLNPNVTRVRTDQREYFANILRSAHGSVLEHANYSFALRKRQQGLHPRAVRHRAGSAFSQESLRYVRLTDIGFRVPPALEPVREQVLSIVEQLEEFQLSAAKELGIDEEGVPFHVKKEVTSALRRLAPIGLSTDIIWTANARTLRHVIEMRTAEGAEEELRLVFDQSRADHAGRGARAVPGLRPPGRRLLGARAPQGLRALQRSRGQRAARTQSSVACTAGRERSRTPLAPAAAAPGQASIVRVRHAPSAQEHDEPAERHDHGGGRRHRHDHSAARAVTVRRALTGLKCTIAWLRIELARAAERADVFEDRARDSCQPISTVSARRARAGERGEADGDHAHARRWRTA